MAKSVFCCVCGKILTSGIVPRFTTAIVHKRYYCKKCYDSLYIDIDDTPELMTYDLVKSDGTTITITEMV